ncbi:MAG: hypothetical protein BJ554DRAFT_8250, partial [Olpidium bornovanus]
MICSTIGSMCFRMLRNIVGWSPYLIARLAFALGALSLSLVPSWRGWLRSGVLTFRRPLFALSSDSLRQSPLATYWAFNVFEAVFGMYSPTMGILRSKHLPERLRATLMSIFRVPLNLIVIISLMNVGRGRGGAISFAQLVLLLGRRQRVKRRSPHRPCSGVRRKRPPGSTVA